jgi:hypothetical protein
MSTKNVFFMWFQASTVVWELFSFGILQCIKSQKSADLLFLFSLWVIHKSIYTRHCLIVILLGNIYITVSPLNPSSAWYYRIQCVLVIYALLFNGRILIPIACLYFIKRNLLVEHFSAHLEVQFWLVCRIAVAAGTWIFVCFIWNL